MKEILRKKLRQLQRLQWECRKLARLQEAWKRWNHFGSHPHPKPS